jgi:hypothetical protein
VGRDDLLYSCFYLAVKVISENPKLILVGSGVFLAATKPLDSIYPTG